MKKYTDSEFQKLLVKVANESKSMTRAAAILNMKYDTFKKYAILLGVFKPNQSGKGTKKKSSTKIPLSDIIEKNLHPQYGSNKLRLRLLREEIKKHQCEMCLRKTWLSNPIPLELDHIDGVHSNHLLSNLRLLCPNCHALTPTYRGKNVKRRN